MLWKCVWFSFESSPIPLSECKMIICATAHNRHSASEIEDFSIDAPLHINILFPFNLYIVSLSGTWLIILFIFLLLTLDASMCASHTWITICTIHTYCDEKKIPTNSWVGYCLENERKDIKLHEFALVLRAYTQTRYVHRDVALCNGRVRFRENRIRKLRTQQTLVRILLSELWPIHSSSQNPIEVRHQIRNEFPIIRRFLVSRARANHKMRI